MNNARIERYINITLKKLKDGKYNDILNEQQVKAYIHELSSEFPIEYRYGILMALFINYLGY